MAVAGFLVKGNIGMDISLVKTNKIKQRRINMSFGIKPLGDRVVIKREEAEEKTESGIILTSQSKEKPQIAEVIAVGPGEEDHPVTVKPGDRVIFSQYGGLEIKYQGEQYIILTQRNIFTTID